MFGIYKVRTLKSSHCCMKEAALLGTVRHAQFAVGTQDTSPVLEGTALAYYPHL